MDDVRARHVGFRDVVELNHLLHEELLD